MGQDVSYQSKQIEREGAIRKEVWIQRRVDGITEQCEASWPGQFCHLKEDLSFVWMEAIALIPIQAIEAQSQPKQHEAPKHQGSPADNELHGHSLPSIKRVYNLALV